MANREGCLWLKAEAQGGPQRRADVWDPARGRFVKVVGFDGQPRMERLPQVGFHGTDITNLRPGKRSDRAIEVMTPAGDIIWKTLTPSAAAEATENDRMRVRREANAKGWIYVGECPIRAVHAGLRRQTLISDQCKPDAAMTSSASTRRAVRCPPAPTSSPSEPRGRRSSGAPTIARCSPAAPPRPSSSTRSRAAPPPRASSPPRSARRSPRSSPRRRPRP